MIPSPPSPFTAADTLGSLMWSLVTLQPQVPKGMKWVEEDRSQDSSQSESPSTQGEHSLHEGAAEIDSRLAGPRQWESRHSHHVWGVCHGPWQALH